MDSDLERHQEDGCEEDSEQHAEKRRRLCTQDSPAAQSSGNAAVQQTQVPVPTAFLLNSQDISELVDLPPGQFLTPDEYEEARSCPAQCNLRLSTALTGQAELESFAALLPAADGCRLSPVIKAQIQRWEKCKEEGRIELKLQIGVSQELLDRVVRAIYERKLLIDSGSFESLLLIADYLQMDWLGQVLKKFASRKLLSKPSAEVIGLAAYYPHLGICRKACMRLLAQAPEPEEVVGLVRAAGPSQRSLLLEAASQPAIAAEKRLEYLLSLSRHPEIELTKEEAKLLANMEANLSLLPTQGWFGGSSEPAALASLRAWGKLYLEQKSLKLAETPNCEGYSFLFWDIPIRRAKGTERLYSSRFLTAADGCRFRMMTMCHDNRVGLYVGPVLGSLKQGDCFKIFAVGSPELVSTIRVSQTSNSFRGLLNLVTQFETRSCNLTCDGEYLPVALCMLCSASQFSQHHWPL